MLIYNLSFILFWGTLLRQTLGGFRVTTPGQTLALLCPQRWPSHASGLKSRASRSGPKRPQGTPTLSLRVQVPHSLLHPFFWCKQLGTSPPPLSRSPNPERFILNLSVLLPELPEKALDSDTPKLGEPPREHLRSRITLLGGGETDKTPPRTVQSHPWPYVHEAVLPCHEIWPRFLGSF